MGVLERLLEPWRRPPPMVVLEPELPAVGEWQLYVPFSAKAIERALLEGGELATSNPINLLGFDRPTIMQRWRLRAISIPIAVRFSQGAGEHPNAVLVVTAELRRAGGRVWQTAGSTERGSVQHNLTLTDRLDPEIVLDAGQRLELVLAVYPYETVENLTVAASARFLTTGTAAVGAEGTIDYQAIAYSGRRAL